MRERVTKKNVAIYGEAEKKLQGKMAEGKEWENECDNDLKHFLGGLARLAGVASAANFVSF